MRIYVASSWRNNYQSSVVDALRLTGHEVYDFKNPRPGDRGFHWSEIDPLWKQWTPEQYRQALSHRIAKDGFASDWNAMRWSEGCVLVLPCGRSAHIEAGYFVGAKKRLAILVPEPIEPELMYEMASTVCLSIDEVVRWAALKDELRKYGRHDDQCAARLGRNITCTCGLNAALKEGA